MPQDAQISREQGSRKRRVPVWFWMLLFMAACLAGFGAYVIATLP
jgi:type VI protein secretion system component VasF